MCLLFLDKSVSRCVLSNNITPPLGVTLPTQHATLPSSHRRSQARFKNLSCVLYSSLQPPSWAPRVFVKEYLIVRHPRSYGESPNLVPQNKLLMIRGSPKLTNHEEGRCTGVGGLCSVKWFVEKLPLVIRTRFQTWRNELTRFRSVKYLDRPPSWNSFSFSSSFPICGM